MRFVGMFVFGVSGFLCFGYAAGLMLSDPAPGAYLNRVPAVPLLLAALILGVGTMYEFVQGITDLAARRRAAIPARDKRP